jgi:8-oxo-dGTP pyrophosphatase MutT (NUDIX family)
MDRLPCEPNPWITHNTETVFENPYVWIERSDVTRPSGNPGEYSVVRFRRRAVAIVALDDEGNTWLIGQYRYAHDTYEWEVPEGGCEPDETPLECAKRELREEAGLEATIWEEVLYMQISNSCTNEVSHTFLARGLTPVPAAPDDTEKLAIHKLPFSEAVQRVINGEIRDALSVASILKVHALRQPR